MKQLQSFVLSKKGTTVLIVSGVLTVVICAVMNFVFIPHIEAGSGYRCFDMVFGYTYDYAIMFRESLGTELISYYLHVQLPLDFVYPLVYTVFFVFLLTRLTGKMFPLGVLPAALMVSDYIENISIIRMLTADILTVPFVSFASAVTSVKTVLMYAVFAVIFVCIIYRIIKRKKQ